MWKDSQNICDELIATVVCHECEVDTSACCLKWILELQPNFQEQKSLVQEVIKATRHLCIFLLKFHCELNYIEFFGGLVKKYLCNNCNYTFDTLKENMSKALVLAKLSTVQLWEQQIYRWVEAYRSDLGTADAQVQVRKFSSTKYKSHRCTVLFRP
jgi:transposase-like protein